MDSERLKRLALGRAGVAKKEKTVKEKPEKSLEDSCAEEVDEIAQAFRDRISKEDKRREQATDTEFWFAVYFPTREAKDAFLRKYGLDKVGDKYLPGAAVDRVLGNRLRDKDPHRQVR